MNTALNCGVAEHPGLQEQAGIAVQAAGGDGGDELQELADAALRHWPVA